MNEGVLTYVASISFVGLLTIERRTVPLSEVAALVSDLPQPFALPMFADVWLTQAT